jgi:two-component system, cell cycle response regulator
MPARVLLIEDNPPSLELMSSLLRHFGHTTLECRNGLDGLEAMRRERPDLVVCDLDLPRLDGCSLAARAKADSMLEAIPIVAVTALAMVGDRDRALSAGFDGYITKPIDPETFVAELEHFLSPPGGPRGQG